MRIGWSAIAGLGAVGLGAAWLSCAVPGFELVDADPASVSVGGGGAGGAGGSEGGAGGTGGCGSRKWPSPPTTSEGGGGLEIVFAMRSVDFGETDLRQGPLVGYDLDGRCSCIDDGPSCNSPQPDEQSCDGPGGTDNAIAELFSAASVFQDDFTSAFHAERAENGEWNLLVRVEGYNGEADDDQVRVSIYPSGGLEEDPCHDGQPPAWDGADAWPVMTPALEPPMGTGGMGAGGTGGSGGEPSCGDPEPEGYDLDAPRYVDPAGYVSGGVLVASLPEAGLVLNSEGTSIDLTAGFLTGALVEQSDGWHLEGGVLAGRWAVTDVFEALSTLASDGMPLCTDDSSYQLVRDAVCAKRDITAQISGPTAACDAISFAMGFEAEEADLGLIYAPQTDDVGACPEETDPANDACPS